MDTRQIRLKALAEVIAAIAAIDADVEQKSDPTMLATDTRRLALEDAHEAVKLLYAESMRDTPTPPIVLQHHAR